MLICTRIQKKNKNSLAGDCLDVCGLTVIFTVLHKKLVLMKFMNKADLK